MSTLLTKNFRDIKNRSLQVSLKYLLVMGPCPWLFISDTQPCEKLVKKCEKKVKSYRISWCSSNRTWKWCVTVLMAKRVQFNTLAWGWTTRTLIFCWHQKRNIKDGNVELSRICQGWPKISMNDESHRHFQFVRSKRAKFVLTPQKFSKCL